MANNYVFTSESVSEGHPDKVADQISDAVLDAILAQDKRGRVACETLIKTGVVIVAGEVTTSAWVDVEALVRKTVLDIGYNSSDMGFDGASCGVLNVIGKPWPGSKMKGMPAAAKPAQCCTMPSRPSGETMPKVMPAWAGMVFRCDSCMAPGWKAVIWLSS